MSDILKDLWKGVEQGWKAGALTPSLPVPSVGRGLLSNPFLTERDRDLQELRELYCRVRSAHASSVFSDEAVFERTLLQIFTGAMRESGAANIDWAVAIGYHPIRRLLETELLAVPDLDEADWQRLTLRSMSELRKLLLRKDWQLAHADDTYALAARAASVLLARVLDAASDGTATGEEGALTLDASLLDVLHSPAEQIEFAWRLFFAQELRDAQLFDDVRLQLERNALTTCRVDPSDPAAWTSKVYLPTHARARGRSPRELVTDYLAETPLTGFFEAEVPISIPNEVRFEHMHVLGGSGHGKSQLLLHLIHHDLTQEEGPGLIVIDSQGDLVRTLSRLELFDPDGSLADRFVLIDPADVEYPVALSLFDVPEERLAQYNSAERERVLNGAIEMYEYVFSSLLGAELTQKQGVIFRFLARLMMLIPGATLHTFLDLMEHGERFKGYMEQLDGTARRFFEDEFFHPSFAATKKQIAKRLWGILANPVFERMFSQAHGKLDFFEAMQERKIILISTAKDVLRQEGAEIFGRLLLAKITQAVMERATLPLNERQPCFLYVDEAQEYVDEQMALLLNQGRKYRVGLTLAHQNLDQLPLALRASVMSSTSIKFAGGVSAKDARALADEMQVDPEFLQGLRKRHGRTEFACHVRNRTPCALSVSIPLGAVNALPQLADDEFKRLIQNNRDAYCGPMRTVAVPAAQPPAPEAVRPAPTPPLEPQPSFAPADPYVAGRGGQDHKYLEHLLRTAAHELGLKAEIEVPISGGSVDVVIEGRGRRIACEVSITTDAEEEAANAAKCLASGFNEVWLVVATARRKAARLKAIRARLGEDDRLRVLTAPEAIAELDLLASEPEAEAKQVRGYTVTVKRTPIDAEEARRKREAVASVLAKSLRQTKE
ncbi:MAG TPA: DUF87 domain-containing protein [Caulobacterales bacterium]|nr:DUF87 domain-containing protein [Caulobacterales bacterium]